MWDYYKHNLPLNYSQLSGQIMAFAASFTLAGMLRNNEMAALLAAGMPLPRLAAPILVASVLLVGVWEANREYLIPQWAEKIARTKDDVIGQRVTGIHCARDDENVIMSAARFYPRDGRVEGVSIITAPTSEAPGELIRADAAHWDERARTWKLDRGLMFSQAATGAGSGAVPTGSAVLEFAFGLSPEELVLRRDAQGADLLGLGKLNALVRSKNLANRTSIEMTRHLRVTQPLVQWLLMILSLPFFLCRAPTNVLNAGGKALLMPGAFFVAVFVASSIVRDAGQASIYAWLPILVFGPIAITRLANVKT